MTRPSTSPLAVLRRAAEVGPKQATERFVRNIRTYGLRDTMKRAQYVGQDYHWYGLDLAAITDQPLDEGLALERHATAGPAYAARAEAYDELSPMHATTAPEHFAAGGELWLVVDGPVAAFACWIFPARTPVGDAPDGWLDLPDGVWCLEDSICAETHRGRGIAPATWSLVAREVATREGAPARLVTKVGDTNIGTQKSLAKVGYARLGDEDPFARHVRARLGH